MNEFVELLKSPGHWMFEILLMIIFDGVIGVIIWPFIKHLIEDHNKFHKNMSPFKSKAQASWLFANKPKMAKEWASHTKSIRSLPEHKKKKK